MFIEVQIIFIVIMISILILAGLKISNLIQLCNYKRKIKVLFPLPEEINSIDTKVIKNIILWRLNIINDRRVIGNPTYYDLAYSKDLNRLKQKTLLDKEDIVKLNEIFYNNDFIDRY